MSLRFVDGKTFMSEEANFEWVMPPFIAVGSSMMLYGRQGLGKSSILMQLVHSLGTGEPWMGFPIHRTGKTLYLGLDMADMETRALLERCDVAGLETLEHIILPRPPAGEDALEFDIFNEQHWKALKDTCDAEKPVAVMVDAIQDAFSTPIGNYDVNQFNREVLKRFKLAVGDAVLIFLNHRRKKSSFKGASEEEDDDSFMGGTAWEAKVAASLMLGYSTQTSRKFLAVKKTRIAESPTKIIMLDNWQQGFYQVQPNVQQLLMMWPNCIGDPVARQTAIDSCLSQRDVFRCIATLSGEKFETIRTAFKRARANGVHFAWADALAGPAKPGEESDGKEVAEAA